jgi:carboxyl-terminal processing protease
VERTLELRVMPWHGDLTDRIHVAVHAGEPEPTPDGTAQVDLSVTGRPRPAFAFDWWIVDDPALVAAAPRRPRAPAMPGEEPFSVHGNGDGMLGPGERVLLAFAARNEGDGAAPDARAFVRNLSGAQGMLEEGLVELGALPPGGRASGAFGITVSPAADPAIPLELDLAVGDAHLRESARQKLRLRVLPERPAFAAERGTMRVEGESARAYGGADGSAPIVADLDAGALIAVVGRASDWAVSQLDGGRRVFVPLDLLAPAAGRGQVPQPLRPVVDPPRVELDPAATRVAAAEIAISGRARHAGRVRDVVITVKGTGAAGHERKVFYRANPEVDGPGAAQLDFQAVVPLEAGANRIVVIARDGSEVEARRDLLVWRE